MSFQVTPSHPWNWVCRAVRGLSDTRCVRRRRRAHRSAVETLEVRQLFSISAPVNYNIGTTNDGFVPNAAPVNVVAADFNRDGKFDLAVTHTSDNSVYMLRGNGDGSFQAAVRIPVSQALVGTELVGDFNNDGKFDLFLASTATGNPAVVLLGNGDGSFQPAIASSSFNGPPGSYPRGWALGDFNRDGKLDVVATLPNSSNTGGYTVLLGNGNGTFQAGIVSGAVLGYSRWVATADFNKDGKLDLATADGQGTSSSIGNVELSVMLGVGDGTFLPPTHYASPQFPDDADANATANPEDVSIGDVNGDGKLDCIVSDYDNTINVFLGNGNGTFQAAISTEVEDYPRGVVVVDMNRDGKKDLVVGTVGIGQGGSEFALEGYQPGYVAVLIGNGDGTFQDAIKYYPSAYPGWTAVADFNGDQFYDLATTQVFSGHSLQLMLNNPVSANLPPTIAVEPSAVPVIAGASVKLSVLGADDGGEGQLTYTWGTVVAPPGAVAFSANGTNAAKTVTATFSKSGTYYFKVNIRDAAGLSVIAMLPVTVSAVAPPTLTSVAVAPSSASVVTGGTVQFTATARDQFGNPLSVQPAMQWSVSGGGTISNTGLFSAGATAGGPFSVTASSGGVTGSSSVTITAAATGTARWTGLGATSNWSEGANWSTQAPPTAASTVIFDATSSKNAVLDGGFAGTVAVVQINSGYSGTISLGQNLIITGNFTESAGNFSAGSSTLFVGGNVAVSGGTFNAGTGTLTFNSSTVSQNVAATGVNFYNVTLANTLGHSLNVSGTLTVNGTFTWLRTAGYITGAGGTGNAAIESRGDIDNQNHGNTGFPYFTLDGTGNQTIKDTSGVVNYNGFIGGDFRGLTINKASGIVILACYPVIYNGLSLLRGSVNTGAFWWFVGNTSNSANIVATATGLNLGNVTLAGNIGSALSAGVQVANLNLGSFGFTAPSVLYVSGNWTSTAQAAFTPNGGTVVFNGTGSQQRLTTGGRAFYNLTIAVGANVQLQDDLTVLSTFAVSGILDRNGHKVNGI